MEAKKVLILGGGFGGLACALHLGKAIGKEHEVTLLDWSLYHTFTPLLYEIATTSQETADDTHLKTIVAFPFSQLLEGTNVRYLNARVAQVDTGAKKVTTTSGILSYDYLVLGLGSEPAYFGIDGLKEHALPIKSFNDAVAIRNKIEKATKEHGGGSLNIVIAGAGATGVEFAGEIAGWVPQINKGSAQKCGISITLFDGNASVLSPFDQNVQQIASNRLSNLGVKIKTGARMKFVRENSIEFAEGSPLPYDILIWTGGVQASEVTSSLGFKKEAKGRIETLPTLEAEENSHVFALGDNACLYAPDEKRPTPWMARPAIIEGRIIAKNIINALKGKKHRAQYKHRSYPYIVPVGGKYAIARVGSHTISGFPAWVFKGLVELNYFRSVLPLGRALRVWLRGLAIFIFNPRLG